MPWPDVVGFLAVVIVVASVIALMVHDTWANRRRPKPPDTLGRKDNRPASGR